MPNPIVTITDGKLKGKTGENYLGETFYSFLGIPYGKPPVGELRFKAPVSAEPWTGIRDATIEGPECPSRHMMFMYPVGSEEKCLNLNVYTREIQQNETGTKPVMVWIHGGGFFHGSNKSEFFGPEYLMMEDIVLVSINYRLGAFGFLCLEDTSLGVPGNAGLKDMILALKWVQKNIKNFNGDPNNVTIFGESAGGACVHYLYLSPLSKGLFHKVIAQSGTSLNCWAKGASNGKILAKDLGLEETSEKKILEHLMKLPVNKIINAQHKAPDTFSADNIRPFGPVVEKKSDESAFLTEEPVELLKSGRFPHIPMMLGYTSGEGIIFGVADKLHPEAILKLKDIESEVPYDLNLEKGSRKSKELADKIEKYYYGSEKLSNRSKNDLYQLKTDIQFLLGIHKCIQLQKQSSQAPIYLYRMSIDTPLNLFKAFSTSRALYGLFFLYFLAYMSGDGVKKSFFLKLGRMLPRDTVSGVCHSDDLGYLFKGFLNEKLQPGGIEEVSMKRFVKLWTNFARTGNPTPESDTLLNNAEWKPVTKEDNYFLDIGQELRVDKNPDAERLQFWDAIYSS